MSKKSRHETTTTILMIDQQDNPREDSEKEVSMFQTKSRETNSTESKRSTKEEEEESKRCHQSLSGNREEIPSSLADFAFTFSSWSTATHHDHLYRREAIQEKKRVIQKIKTCITQRARDHNARSHLEGSLGLCHQKAFFSTCIPFVKVSLVWWDFLMFSLISEEIQSRSVITSLQWHDHSHTK